MKYFLPLLCTVIFFSCSKKDDTTIELKFTSKNNDTKQEPLKEPEPATEQKRWTSPARRPKKQQPGNKTMTLARGRRSKKCSFDTLNVRSTDSASTKYLVLYSIRGRIYLHNHTAATNRYIKKEFVQSIAKKLIDW